MKYRTDMPVVPVLEDPSLDRDGCCVLRGVVNEDLLAAVKRECSKDCIESPVYMAQVNDKRKGRDDRNLADVLPFFPESNDLYVELVHTVAAAVRRECDDVRYLKSILIPKYPGEWPRWFHDDWWAWDEVGVDSSLVPQVGCLVYLDDATQDRGALMVVPGSHRKVHLGYRGTLNMHPEARVVEARAGDCTLFDIRLLHASTGNQSAEWRIAVRIWFMANWGKLPDQLRASASSRVVDEHKVI